MYCLLIPEKWNQTSILIELKRKLFIHQKDIVHLCIEIRITVICDFVRLYICFPKNGIYRTFMYGGKPCKACCFRCFIDMGCQPGICPCFSCVSKISWFLAGEIDNPRFFLTRDFGISAASGCIKKSIFNASLYFLWQSITLFLFMPT